MKFAFVTCVQLGLSCIERIYEIGGKLDLLVTLHDHKATKKSGRIYLDEFAQKHSIPLLKINHINDPETKDAIKRYEIDYLYIIGWSQIADEEIINLPSRGTFGMHPTLLPEGRGRAAIPWAIIKGLERTGVSMFKLDSGVDTGSILDQVIIPIEQRETATTLYNKVNIAHEELIAKAYLAMQANIIELVEQNESEATIWEGRTPADGEITSDMTLSEADSLIRATTHPYPGAFIKTIFGKRIIWSADLSESSANTLHLKDGALYLTEFEDIIE